jgi:hypothetical protein
VPDATTDRTGEAAQLGCGDLDNREPESFFVEAYK